MLSELAEHHETKLNVVPIEGLEAVFFHFVPMAWLPSMKFAPTLNIGVYAGEEKRIVGTEQIPLAELTPEFVGERSGRGAGAIRGYDRASNRVWQANPVATALGAA